MTRLLDPVRPESFGNFESFVTFPGVSDPATGNFYALACRRFTLDAVPAEATLNVCAHTRYVVYLNGVRLGQGPENGSDGHAYIDQYRIADLLRRGPNVVALEIGHQGNIFRTCVPSIPDFWCRLAPEGRFGDWSDGWLVMPDPSRLPGSPEFTFQMGYTVLRDIGRLPENWAAQPELLSGWQKGLAADNPNHIRLGWRDLAPLTENTVRPAKLVTAGYLPTQKLAAGDPLFGKAIDAETRVVNAQAFDAASGTVRSAEPTGGAYLIYDFEQEFYGSPVLEIDAPEGGVLDIVYGETLEDGRLQAFYPFECKPRARTAADGTTYVDRTILRAGHNTVDIRLQERGGRIVELLFRNFGGKLILREFSIEDRVYPGTEAAEQAFHSDDAYYNALWKMCVHTVAHCAGDHIIDCPWREQAFWINDAVVSGLYNLLLNQDPRMVRHGFELALDGFEKFGDMPAVYPAGDPLFFPSMPALWILAMADYYMYTGDESIRTQYADAIDAVMSEYDRLGHGELLVPNHEEWWNFIDLGYADAGVEIKGHSALLNALRMAAYQAGAMLHTNPVRQTYYRELGERLGKALVALLWDEKHQYFHDSDRPGFGAETHSVHTPALLLCCNLLPELHQAFARNLVDAEAIPAEPYFQRYRLEALALTGQFAAAEATIRTLWKKMVDSKSPTLWEIALKGPKRRGISQSLCHAWAAAPVSYALRSLAGVRPLKPGYVEFSFVPSPGVCGKFECRIPTPQGEIQVRRDGTHYELTVPQNTVAVAFDGNRYESGIHPFTI